MIFECFFGFEEAVVENESFHCFTGAL